LLALFFEPFGLPLFFAIVVYEIKINK